MGVVERLGGGAGGVIRKASFPPIVDMSTRVLILGSLPGDASLAAGHYYAHPQNQFWRLLSPAIGVDLPALAYDERLATLRAAGIGLWDVVASATRPGSSDAAIRDATANDVAALIATLPELRLVAFNGGTAAKAGRALVRGVETLALPSSSPLHTVGVAAKKPAWDAIGAYLSDRPARPTATC
ncbi:MULTISPECIES: DNA-deoxyinosine glycosylase [Sphingomonas]|jgi:hypoxanthine-DNA glycosylase|uniref:DNA-deoxyinosine glycosylase n=2 Tax=Sphingomonas hankookensis TaxID=563996 RepID=A0ABR5YG90_9SPHN|nr:MULTISPECIES: DNA-deoxyinosine glycosylase [Sphingomonas]KZE18649.1 DNA-deoxyinosine glycosylase [Sphingomonas hankookensis]PZT94919.1 MAG: DNA-deoxyinosine glycosylase [Sphingomonas sp.]RSV33648.1 DNA-deoxyinosine glycosylase [Sphingomonas sp. ABOLH]